MMEVKKDTDGENAIVSIAGEIDSTNAEIFERKLREAVAGEKKVVLDLAELEYISSAGLRIFW